MSGKIHGIAYFPNCPQKLVTWGKDVAIYDVKPRKTGDTTEDHKNPTSFQCTTKSVEFLVSENRYQYVRCLRPSYHTETIVALGTVSGKVGISKFDAQSDTVCEFSEWS
ncbi:MIOS family protein [Megaselia abdita]